jgi:hypothetical protein
MKREVGEAFLTLWANNYPIQPSIHSVFLVARVGWNYASKVIEELLIHNDDQMKFLESKSGLYYYYNANLKTKSANYSFINSISTNKSLYTR